MSWSVARPKVEHPEWLEVVRLDRNDWRVSDLREPAGDSRRLLGYVERLARHRYEVVWMGDRMRWGYVDSLSGALGGLADAESFAGDITARRARPAPPARSLLRRIRRRGGARESSDLYLA